MDLKVQQKLAQLEKTQKEFWNIIPEAGSLLNLLIKTGKYRNVLEVGTSNGYSAIWFALAIQETGGHLVTIEYFQHRLDLAKKNLNECDLLDTVTFVHGKALDVLDKIESSFFESTPENKNIYNTDSDIYKPQPPANTAFVDESVPFIDFAFIDASKLEYVDYFKLIHPKIKKGGMIVADNVVSHDSVVKNYTNIMMNHKDYQTIKLYLGGGLLISLKK